MSLLKGIILVLLLSLTSCAFFTAVAQALGAPISEETVEAAKEADEAGGHFVGKLIGSLLLLGGAGASAEIYRRKRKKQKPV